MIHAGLAADAGIDLRESVVEFASKERRQITGGGKLRYRRPPAAQRDERRAGSNRPATSRS
jgi:hypothetical protein